jgi:F0F1-type ATP synthase assembly protein I
MTRDERQPPEPQPSDANDGWRIFGSMISGMALYGGIGWLIGHWTGVSILFPLGMFFGLALAVLGIFVRFAKS